MPSKHIDEITWRKVEKETVKAVIASQTAFKDTEILKLLILKGLESVKEEDYRNAAMKKNRE